MTQSQDFQSRRCFRNLVIAAAAANLLGLGAARAASYSVTDLGPYSNLAGRTDSNPMEVNDAGQVAAVNVQGSSYRALLYSGSWKDLGTLGGSEGAAAGLNQSGQVAGTAQLASGLHHAFIWTPGATDGVSGNPQMKDLGALQAGGESFGYAVNRLGQVAGAAQVGNGDHAVISSSGALKDISTALRGLPYSFGYGINDSGHVAGTAYDASYTSAHAFFYNGQSAADLGKILGGSAANALALNNSDVIAGYYTTGAGVDHAFVYSGGNATDLGTLGGHYSYANCINNQNVVVGGSFIDGSDTVYHAFIYNGTAMSDLNQQLDGTGAGWTLVEARAISDSGLIVGVGTLGGASHFFLLSPSTTTGGSTGSGGTGGTGGTGGSGAFHILSVRAQGANLVLTFETPVSGSYSVLTASAVQGAPWTTALAGITSNGASTTVTLNNAVTGGKAFYRVEHN